MKYINLNYFVARQGSEYCLFASDEEDNWYEEGILIRPISQAVKFTFIIVKEYGIDCDHSGEMYDKYLRDYPPKPDKIENIEYPLLGWIAPDGRFFGCTNGDHQNLSYILHTAFYTVDGDYHSYDTYHKLIEHGWISIHYGFVMSGGDYLDKVTFEQYQVLRQISKLNTKDEEYTEAILEFMERVEKYVQR